MEQSNSNRKYTSPVEAFTDPDILSSRVYLISLDIFNAVTHGIGFILSIIGTWFLLKKGVHTGSIQNTIAYLIFGVSMCSMYFTSTIYHALYQTRLQPIFQFFDHSMIYILIAGSYTPFCLIALNNWIGWLIFGLEWLIAFVGIFGKFTGNPFIRRYSTWIYLLMGWLALVALPGVIQAVPRNGLLWVVAGGIFYSIGTIFYANDKKFAYFHVAWHLFVMLGSACIFLAILFYV